MPNLYLCTMFLVIICFYQLSEKTCFNRANCRNHIRTPSLLIVKASLCSVYGQ